MTNEVNVQSACQFVVCWADSSLQIEDEAFTPDREGRQLDSLGGCDWRHSRYFGIFVLPLLPTGNIL
jgi:hypothetical protein